MEITDVVVVGAGPAGSSAAYFLAKRGLDVILLEKNELPRDKTCGDGLGPRSIEMLKKMDLDDWLRRKGYYRCDRVRLFSNNGSYFEAKIPSEDTPSPHFIIAPRRDLDHKLVEAVSDAGAKVFTNCRASALVRSDGSVKAVKAVRGGEEFEIACKAVVCADGTHGTFAKQTGLDIVKPHAIAVRAYYDNVKGLDDCINIYIDEHIPEGYAWIFPTSPSSANIGLGVSTPMLKNKNVDLKKLQDWFIKEKDASPIDLSGATITGEVKGAYLRMGYGRHKTVSDGLMLVGDAAGLISPLSGEGIAYALESGELAAAYLKKALDKGDVSANELKPYSDHLNKHFFMDHRLYEALRQMLAKYALMDRMVTRGMKYPELAGKFVSVMMSTAKPASIFKPKMLKYYFL